MIVWLIVAICYLVAFVLYQRLCLMCYKRTVKEAFLALSHAVPGYPIEPSSDTRMLSDLPALAREAAKKLQTSSKVD